MEKGPSYGKLDMELPDQNDFVEIIRLLGLIGDPNEEDLTERRRLLARGLAGLVGADNFSWSIGVMFPDQRRVTISATIVEGDWGDSQKETLNGIIGIEQSGVADISSAGQMQNSQDRIVSGFRTLKQREIMYCLRWLGATGFSCLALHRPSDKPPFGERDRFLIHVVLQNIDWIHDACPQVDVGEKPLRLTYRQREVLLQLLQGRSRKSIAASLGLSEYTIVEYMSQIYRRFNARNRGELLSFFISREHYQKE